MNSAAGATESQPAAANPATGAVMDGLATFPRLVLKLSPKGPTSSRATTKSRRDVRRFGSATGSSSRAVWRLAGACSASSPQPPCRVARRVEGNLEAATTAELEGKAEGELEGKLEGKLEWHGRA
ncbi:hypothetical protein EJB05_37494, partial [Eragrostis curvula]